MGCVQSKIENEETVTRCKDRKLLMERSVTSRNRFSAAHVANAVSLRDTGAALSDFSPGEVTQLPHSVSLPVSSGLGLLSSGMDGPATSQQHLPPPPPPPNSNFNSTLQRAATMPELVIHRSEMKRSDTIIEEETDEDDESTLKRRSRSRKGGIYEPQQEMSNEGAHWDYFKANPSLAELEDHGLGDPRTEKEVESPPSELHPQPATSMVVKKVKKGGSSSVKGSSNVSLAQILLEIDDCFLKAFQSAQEISRMLEATRVHYHSNFADQRGNFNHSDRIMRVITWNRSFKGSANGAANEPDDFDSQENETHASVLDKMLAWEKKLYDEVKTGEQMKLEYQKKVASLNKLKKRGSNTEALERMKAAVSQQHTRFIVDMQSMDSTVAEINRLRDEQLYPKLIALVEGMATMWDTMRIHHLKQSSIVEALKLLDNSNCPSETSDHHHERTRQLGGVVQEWHTNFCELMTHQKDYISALTSWLKLNLIPIDIHWKEKASSPERLAQNRARPILYLLTAWHDQLQKLSDEPAKAAISNFAGVIKTIYQHQKEELEYRNKCVEANKDLIKKSREFESWHTKFVHKRAPDDEMVHDKELIAEKQLIVEAARSKLKEDEEAYQRQCLQVRDKSLMSLKTQLPQLFQALHEFSAACSRMYTNLRSSCR